VTVCAPWSALTRYKFKVKLTPGSMKKGKAARAAAGGFLACPVDETDGEKMSPREELLASLKGILTPFPLLSSSAHCPSRIPDEDWADGALWR
jgi:hypothetical protein